MGDIHVLYKFKKGPESASTIDNTFVQSSLLLAACQPVHIRCRSPPLPPPAPGGHLRRMGSKPTMHLNPLLSYLERQRQLAGALQEIS